MVLINHLVLETQAATLVYDLILMCLAQINEEGVFNISIKNILNILQRMKKHVLE
jgi:hypothetical protein